MAHNQGGGGFDPRFHNQQYGNYYDPRYQQQPYAPPQQNFQIQIPVSNFPYHNLQQQSPHQQPPHQSPLPAPPQQSPGHPHLYQTNHQQFYHQPVYSNQIHTPPYQPSPVQHHNALPQQQNHRQSPLIQHQSPPIQHQSPSIQHQSPPLQHQSPPIQRSTIPQMQHRPNHQQHYPPSPVVPGINGHLMHPSPAASLSGQQENQASPPLPASLTAPAPIPTPKAAPVPSVSQSPAAKMEQPPQPPQPPQLPPMELDYTSLIIDLAEKYFETAYGNGTKSASGFRQMPDTFCRLIATGLACLDVVLGELRSLLQPPIEAAVRLRYATVLYMETENYMDAEDMLSKGMSLCERFRLTELKYNMQHLLARVTFLKNPKAAVRYLDGVIRDVEAVNHAPWVYAMRFLRVALSLQMGQAQEILTAQSQLKVISSLATSRKDISAAAVANGMDALIQLHRSTNNESIEHIQRALASARSSQLNSQAQNIHQLAAMMYFVDVLCSVYHANQHEAQSKMAEMNSFLDQQRDNPAWTTNGEFLVPLSKSTSEQSGNVSSESGVVHMNPNGEVSLRLQWLPKDEVYTLAYVISAAVVMTKNPLDGHQAETYLQQASKMLKLNDKGQEISWRKRLRCEIQAQTVFALCSRSAWGAATKELQSLKDMVQELPNANELSMHMLVPLLEASIFQGAGETEKALDIYMQPPLSIETAESAASPSTSRDFSILATLNALLIICLPSHPRYSDFDHLFARLEPLALDHPSRDIQAAYNLVHAVSLNTGPDYVDAESASMLKTKQYLTQALQAAKRTGNNQLCCITLNFMTWRYFRGVVGEQPVKSAMSAQALARKGQNSLWMSVADGLLADTLETQGRTEEANNTRQESLDLAGKLPALMQRSTDQPRM